jgi:hypothetical protein
VTLEFLRNQKPRSQLNRAGINESKGTHGLAAHGNTEFYSNQSVLQKKEDKSEDVFVGFRGSPIRFCVERCAVTLSQIDIPVGGGLRGGALP